MLEIVSELIACLEPCDMPHEGGIQPLRACGTQFVSHKMDTIAQLGFVHIFPTS